MASEGKGGGTLQVVVVLGAFLLAVAALLAVGGYAVLRSLDLVDTPSIVREDYDGGAQAVSAAERSPVNVPVRIDRGVEVAAPERSVTSEPAPPVEPVAEPEPPPPPPSPAPTPTEESHPVPPPAVARPPRAPKPQGERHEPAPPVTQGPVLDKGEAKRLLEPKVLACMQQAKVHYLITRVGQGHRAKETGPLPPVSVLGDPEPNYVDYRRVRRFEATPLGRCVNRATEGLRVRAFKGNYIYLGLRNPGVPDPLAGLPTRIDAKAAEAALEALDGRARACVAAHPAHATEGKKLHIQVRFTGPDGAVSRVEPYYLEPRSPFTRCIVRAYESARVGKFRDLEDDVSHSLQL